MMRMMKMALDPSKLKDELTEAINAANEQLEQLQVLYTDGGKDRDLNETQILAAFIADAVIRHIQENADVIIDPHRNAVGMDPGGTTPVNHPVQISRQKGRVE